MSIGSPDRAAETLGAYMSTTTPTRWVVKARSRRRSRVKAAHQVRIAPMRFRYPVRKAMWMNSQPTQPGKPLICSGPADMTALPREM